MILFIFEDRKREPGLFKTIDYLYFPKGQTIVCSFGNNIYELYRLLSEMDGDGDIVSILRERNTNNPDSPFAADVKSSDFSEIYLFFDYDFQNKNIPLKQMNSQIEEMLEMFSDETDAGKLYINYPMVEALRYTKTLPDADFHTYIVSRQGCAGNGFKNLAQQFSSYGSFDFIMLDFRNRPSKEAVNRVYNNWNLSKNQTASKANLICNDILEMPQDKEDISQIKLFYAQLEKHIIPFERVSVISALPLFLFEYFRTDVVHSSAKQDFPD